MKKVYNVCWSGGVDSTFIVTQLSQFPVIIRSYYIKGQTFRLSEPYELSAISSIYNELINDSRTKAEITPLNVLEKDDYRIKSRDIVNAHRRIYIQLLKEYKEKNNGKLPPAGSQQIYADGAFVSPQYVSCASLAEYLGEPIEIGLLRDDFEGNPSFSFLHDILDTQMDSITGRRLMYVKEDVRKKDAFELFKDLRFPIAGQDMYKKDVWNWYAYNNYLRVRSKTNFCQDPIIHDDGTIEPCGICTACIGVIKENVLEPFTEAGINRYKDYEENHEKDPARFRLKGF